MPVNNDNLPGSRPHPLPNALLAGRNGRILLLGWTAGCIDAIGYLGLGRVFTANMTGNTVLLGVALGQGETPEILRATIALAGFALGVALGAVVVRRQPEHKSLIQKRWSTSVNLALVLEWTILLIFGVSWYLAGPDLNDPVKYILIMLSVVAMGLQSAAVEQLGVVGISTTYLTGTLTSFVAELVVTLKATIARVTARRYAPPAPGRSAKAKGSLGLKAALWCIYALAAIVCSQAEIQWRAFSILLPLVGLAFVIISAFFRPE
jgi:uncharacterized membrane protein YoaK (UPF0700 family)